MSKFFGSDTIRFLNDDILSVIQELKNAHDREADLRTRTMLLESDSTNLRLAIMLALESLAEIPVISSQHGNVSTTIRQLRAALSFHDKHRVPAKVNEG